MKRTHAIIPGVVALLACIIGCQTVERPLDPAADFGAIVRDFSVDRHNLDNELSQRLALPLPAGVSDFFHAAEAGDWLAVSNRFETFIRPETYGTAIPELRNELWAPIHETLGLYEVWEGWKHDSTLLKMFYAPVLSSMPKGSVYFGGTEHGRFAITAMNAVKTPPSIFCITQNALADNTYLSYLRAVYGKNLWLPDQEDGNKAFQRYVREVQAGTRKPNEGLVIKDGKVTISGALDVMQLNGLLCEMILSHNADSHEFFVEESYVLDWMYPYLEPHGLIMKLNPKPLDKLSEPMVEHDRTFWRDYIQQLEANPGFGTNVEAQKAFSKLRSAIAGIYVYRKMYGEAEASFRQAIRLCRISPEANFRLAKMYEEQGRIMEAVTVIGGYLKSVPQDSKAEDYLRQLKGKRQGISPSRTEQ